MALTVCPVLKDEHQRRSRVNLIGRDDSKYKSINTSKYAGYTMTSKSHGKAYATYPTMITACYRTPLNGRVGTSRMTSMHWVLRPITTSFTSGKSEKYPKRLCGTSPKIPGFHLEKVYKGDSILNKLPILIQHPIHSPVFHHAYPFLSCYPPGSHFHGYCSL